MVQILNDLKLIGLPSMFAVISAILGIVIKLIGDMKILQNAQKAQMRSQLLHQYYSYKDKVLKGESIPADDIDDWINQYKAYHKLVGENGVLDARKNDLLTFPTYQRN